MVKFVRRDDLIFDTLGVDPDRLIRISHLVNAQFLHLERLILVLSHFQTSCVFRVVNHWLSLRIAPMVPVTVPQRDRKRVIYVLKV